MLKESEVMKVAIISQYFYPDNAQTGNLMTSLAIGLSNKGCDVEIYSGYPSYWGIKQKCNKREIYKNVKISRIFHFQMDTRTKIGSIVHGLSFFIFTLFKLIISSDKRIYLIVTTPPFLPFIGYILKKIKKCKYAVIIHDIDPDISIKINFIKEGWITWIWDRCNLLMYKNTDSLIVLSNCMAEVIRKKMLFQPLKIEIIQNWEDENFIKPKEKSNNYFAINNNFLNKYVILYSGNMGLNHNLESFIKAAQFIKKSNIQFLFIGEGTQKKAIIKMTHDLNIMNVTFFDFQPREILPEIMTCGDVILISQEKGTDGLCVSSKFYTALAAGKPIIALVGEESEISNVLKRDSCGFSISSYNPEEIANRILQLESDKELCIQFGKNARKTFENNYTFSHALNKYYGIIQNLY